MPFLVTILLGMLLCGMGCKDCFVRTLGQELFDTGSNVMLLC